MKKEKGFAAVELAIVLVIFGVVMGSAVILMDLYTKRKAIDETNENIDAVYQALIDYKDQWGAYPCPADPTLGPGNPNYGREQRAVAWGPGAAPAPGYLNSDCTLAGITQAASRDVDNADNDNTVSTGGENVLIGALPIMTLLDPDNNPQTANGVDVHLHSGDMDLPERVSLDGWGHKLTYVVTKWQTRTGPNAGGEPGYNDNNGAIDLRDENDLSVMDVEDINHNDAINAGEDLNLNGVLDPGRYAHFTLISHGENGMGAYTREGRQVQPCPAALPLPPGGETATPLNETENCDNDGVFLSGLRTDKNHSYNDDIAVPGSFQTAGLWERSGDQMYNVNAGNVGVTTNTPREKLHVNGDITARKVWAERYTDQQGSAASIMTADVLGGNGTTVASAPMQCPPGQVVSSIDQNRVTCVAGFTMPAGPMPCPAGLKMQGISSATGVICCNPALVVGAAGACN